MVDYAAMRASVLTIFGKPTTVTVGAVGYPLTAAYMAPYTGGVDLGGVQINRPDPQFIAATADWAATGAQTGDTIASGSDVYTVVDVQSTDDGMTTLTVRRY